MGPNRRPVVAAATLGAEGWENREGAVAETTEQDGSFTCKLCGAERPAGWACGCGGREGGQPMTPEGWDPELTRTSRPRLDLVARPDPPRPEE